MTNLAIGEARQVVSGALNHVVGSDLQILRLLRVVDTDDAGVVAQLLRCRHSVSAGDTGKYPLIDAALHKRRILRRLVTTTSRGHNRSVDKREQRYDRDERC
jgi:hypothetical protein